MVETARKYRRIVQHGTQCRSSPNIREGVQRLREGVIGKVYLAGAVTQIRGAIGRLTTQPVPKGLNWEAWSDPRPSIRTALRGDAVGTTSGISATGSSAIRACIRWT